MTPLIDADILLHELGWSGQFKDKETGEEILFEFDYVRELLDAKIEFICDEAEATEAPILFITDSQWLTDQRNKRNTRKGLPLEEYEPVFRFAVAVSKPYKGQRKNPKPFHFYNIIAHLMANYNVVVSSNGLEADDELCIVQYGRDDTIICSRDKDLRICPGWHYSWECGGQASHGPTYTDHVGWLDFSEPKTLGYGKAFFYYQMLVGDSADNIPGLPGWGEAAARKLLAELKTEKELFESVKLAYKDHPKLENSKEYFMEQAQLLWMRMDKGQPYKIPKFKGE